MANPIGPQIDLLYRRVRDESGMGTSRALVRLILSLAQQILNAYTKTVRVSETLTTNARRLIYPIRLKLPYSTLIERVRDEDRDLACEEDWKQFANFLPVWFRTVAVQHSCYTIIGRDLLAVFPAKDHDSTVEVRSVKLTDAFVDDTSLIEIPEPDFNMLLDIGEFIISMKSRRLARAKELLKLIQVEVKEARGLDKDRE